MKSFISAFLMLGLSIGGINVYADDSMKTLTPSEAPGSQQISPPQNLSPFQTGYILSSGTYDVECHPAGDELPAENPAVYTNCDYQVSTTACDSNYTPSVSVSVVSTMRHSSNDINQILLDPIAPYALTESKGGYNLHFDTAQTAYYDYAGQQNKYWLTGLYLQYTVMCMPKSS